MATVLVGVVREMLERAPAPRNVLVRFRLGQVFGEPGAAVQQRAVLGDALAALFTIRQAGAIVELPYRWKRSEYQDPLARPGDTAP
jgi:hypothetical protein